MMFLGSKDHLPLFFHGFFLILLNDLLKNLNSSIWDPIIAVSQINRHKIPVHDIGIHMMSDSQHSWLLLLTVAFLEINVKSLRKLKKKKKIASLSPSNIVITSCCRMFTDSCKRMRIMKSSEAIGLGMDFLSCLVPSFFIPFSFCDYYRPN